MDMEQSVYMWGMNEIAAAERELWREQVRMAAQKRWESAASDALDGYIARRMEALPGASARTRPSDAAGIQRAHLMAANRKACEKAAPTLVWFGMDFARKPAHPAISGLTTEHAGDHRLGRWK